MRRKDREITKINEIVDIIEKCAVCRLAFNDEPFPYILPLNFGFEVNDGKITLYFHGAAEGRKFELLEKNNHVSFEMDCAHRLITGEKSCDCTMEYKSVIGQGQLEIVAEEDKENALTILMGHYAQVACSFDPAWFKVTKMMKLTVESITGKALIKDRDQ